KLPFDIAQPQQNASLSQNICLLDQMQKSQRGKRIKTKEIKKIGGPFFSYTWGVPPLRKVKYFYLFYYFFFICKRGTDIKKEYVLKSVSTLEKGESINELCSIRP